MKTLRAVEIKEYYINRVSSGLNKYFWDNLFGAIFKILKENSVVNDSDALLNAIRSGRVYYKNGAFRTDKRFSNAISLVLERLGARYRNGAYYIEARLIPSKYVEAIGIVETLAAARAGAINSFLLNYFEKIQNIRLEDFINAAVDKMYESLEADLVKSFQEKKVPIIELDVNLKKIADDYTYNMQYWVKKWEEKNIVKMRQDVLKMTQEGVRVPKLQEYFEKRWKVAKDKAHFLAVNESHLAGSVIKATQYQQIGCKEFVWSRSSSREKRKLHEEYYGKVFRFDEPPVIDEKLGIKGLPRQIWNCKCHMLPVLPEIRTIGKVINAKRNIFKKAFNKIKNSKQCNNNSWRYRRFG